MFGAGIQVSSCGCWSPSAVVINWLGLHALYVGGLPGKGPCTLLVCGNYTNQVINHLDIRHNHVHMYYVVAPLAMGFEHCTTII